MNRLDELEEKGREATNSAKDLEAAMYYEEAYRLAIDMQLDTKISKLGMSAIHCNVYNGNLLKTLTLILELKSKYENLLRL
jgi:hypothetical protein